MGGVEQVLGRLVVRNNERIRRAGAGLSNPRDLDGVGWDEALRSAQPAIRAEWDRFEAAGGRLPLIEDLIDEHQGNEGAWRAGLLVTKGRPCEPLASRFPETVRALRQIPGLWSALWSLMEPGTELGEHVGPNAGVLRYHLGVRCPEGAVLRVGDVDVPYRDGVGILFDDTQPHAAWNRSQEPRATLFCEVLTPLPPAAHAWNVVVQRAIALDPRYRDAPGRAAAWDAALNRGLPTGTAQR